MKPQLSIIGFGRFGQFLACHLGSYFDIVIFDTANFAKEAKRLGVKQVSFEEAASGPTIILAVPIQMFDKVTKKLAKLVKKETLVIDIASVKVIPEKFMRKNLGGRCRLLFTHPLFGPQTCPNSIEGKNFVICSPKSNKDAQKIASFAKNKLKLNVFWKTSKEHDLEMAYSQGITHFLGRAINELKLPPAAGKTLAYQKLMDLAENVSKDTPSLWLGIMKENPYAEMVRKKFLKKQLDLEKLIEKSK